MRLFKKTKVEKPLTAAEILEKENAWLEREYHKESDMEYNIRKHYEIFGKKPNLSNPETFSEKLIYLKLHYHNLLENVCADKHSVCDYIRQCGYESILKDTYQVALSPDEIDLDRLPDIFFAQCTHTQGYNYVLRKNDTDNITRVKEEYSELLKRKHYWIHRENCYKFIQPKIIFSEYLEEPGQKGLTDYKFYCFSGEPKYFMVSYGEFEHQVRNHKFDMEWNSIDRYFKSEQAVDPAKIKKPANFDKMVEIVTKLCAPFPHVRVDLYNIVGRIVFGELTFYSSGGFVNVASPEMDKKIGSWIDLSKYQDYMIFSDLDE